MENVLSRHMFRTEKKKVDDRAEAAICNTIAGCESQVERKEQRGDDHTDDGEDRARCN